MYKQQQTHTNAFTLIELIAVVLVIGVMASLGVAYYGIVLERMQASEGVNHLMAILGAEKRWVVDSTSLGGAPPRYTTNLDVLDIKMNSDWHNFQSPQLFGVAVGSNAIVASIPRNAAAPFNYTLSITERRGTISCTNGVGGIGTRTKLGF